MKTYWLEKKFKEIQEAGRLAEVAVSLFVIDLDDLAFYRVSALVASDDVFNHPLRRDAKIFKLEVNWDRLTAQL